MSNVLFWCECPELADGDITVSNPAKAERYSIKNILGQVVLDGGLAGAEQQVDISRLPAGNYVLNLYKDGVPAGHKMFVKK